MTAKKAKPTTEADLDGTGDDNSGVDSHSLPDQPNTAATGPDKEPMRPMTKEERKDHEYGDGK